MRPHSRRKNLFRILTALLCAVATLLAGLVVLATTPVTVSPRNGATAVAGNVGASLTYDEDLDPASVGSPTFLVYSSQQGLLPGTYTASGPTVSFDPAANFLPGETLLAVGTGGIQTSSGLNVPAHTWQFVAASAPASGTFTLDRSITLGGATTRSIALADVNGDGWLDAAVGNDLIPTTQNVIYLNNGTGQFSGGTKNIGSGFDSTRVIALADIDRNGTPDAIVGNRGEQSTVYLNDGSGNFTAGQRPFGQPTATMEDLAVADFNGDGWLDIIAALAGQQPQVYLSAFGFFGAAGTAIGQASWETVSVDAADFEGDGDLDLVLGNRSTSTRNVIIRNDGTGAFTTWLNFGNIDDESRVARFLDANRDGKMDVVLGNYASQNKVYLGNGAGGFYPSTPISFGTGTDHTEDIVTGDFNGDSFPDIAVANRNQQNRIYFYDPLLQTYGADSNFGPANDISLSLAAGDIDGDGDLDLAVGNYGQQSLAYLNGSAIDAYAPTVAKSGVTVSPYTAGSVVTWTIAARHNGPAADLYLTDMLGPDFIYLSHTAEPALTVSSTGPAFSGFWPNSALGQAVTLTLVTRLAGTMETTPTNTATFTTTSYLTPTETAPALPSCGGQPCQYYPPGQVPAVGKRGVSAAPYTAGSLVTWTITATNRGALDDFYLTDPLEPDFSYVSHNASPALAETYATQPTFRAKWAAVEAGQTVTLTLVTRLSGSGTLPVTNTASFTTTTYLTPTETVPAEPYCGVIPCPFLPPAVALAPASQSQTVLPGRAVDFNFTLSNRGTLPDSFGLASSSLGPANLAPASPVSVDGYGSLPLTLSVTIPAGTISDSVVSNLITATSQTDAGASDTAVATTIVGFDPGQGLEIEPVIVIAPPLSGTVETPITVTHLITNTANTTDVVGILASPPTHWPALTVVSPTLPVILGPGMTARVTVRLAAPISATLMPVHTAIVTATSNLTTTPAVAQDTIIVIPAPDGDADGDGILNRYEDRDGDGGYNDDDSDGDRTPDYLDPDDDGDGVWTTYEYPNPTDPLNTDGDALPDYLDPDDDNDSRPTRDEGADPNGDGNPADALDSDGDGTPNYLDGDDGYSSGSDADGDGIPDATECPATPCPDSDGDGIPNYLDPDSDNDGVLDSYEYDNLAGNDDVADDTDGDGTPDYLDADDDGDGKPTMSEQADPNGDGNPADALDSDGDGIPDYLDPDDNGGAGGGDSDQDGISDTIECPALPCLDSDGDGTPDYRDVDSDNDGVHDRYEYDRNGDGTADDTDLDNSPDYRDPDDDGDGRPTTGEQADPNGDGNPADALDTDGDGVPDYLDADDSGDILPDADGDGIPNTTECPALPCLDSDGDGMPDYRDTDSDDDGVLDRYECPYLSCRDTDGDGTPDYRDFDDDEDGALTVLEQADPNGDGNPADAVDSDGDGIPDYLDADDQGGLNGGDSDQDGIPDGTECAKGVPCEDSDGDTIPDYMDPIDNPTPGLYLRLRENEAIVWQGVVSGAVSVANLPPAQVEPEQVLSYAITISNTGSLVASYQLTSTFSAGLDSPGQETIQEALAPAAMTTLTYIQQVAATETATINICFELDSPYGVRSIVLSRTVRVVGNPSDLYLPTILKNY